MRATELDATIWTYQRALASIVVFKSTPSSPFLFRVLIKDARILSVRSDKLE
jgi:hypothetical protein